MSNKISETVRNRIIEELISIGQLTGDESYCTFFQHVYPKASTISTWKKTLLQEIRRHCDINPVD